MLSKLGSPYGLVSASLTCSGKSVVLAVFGAADLPLERSEGLWRPWAVSRTHTYARRDGDVRCALISSRVSLRPLTALGYSHIMALIVAVSQMTQC